MNVYAADLHIHTALSPCGADEMTPPAIVQAALAQGLAMIAICDHNTAGNTAAVQAQAGDRLAVIAAMETTTAEEVHVLGLFPNAAAAMEAASEVLATLPPADESDARHFGEQWLMDAEGHVVGHEPRLLATASAYPLTMVVELIHHHGGLAIAAHVNRMAFSVVSQLGLIPDDAGFDALEVFAPPGAPVPVLDDHHLPLLRSSDAHYLADIGRCRTSLQLTEPTFDELACALRGERGRGVLHA